MIVLLSYFVLYLAFMILFYKSIRKYTEYLYITIDETSDKVADIPIDIIKQNFVIGNPEYDRITNKRPMNFWLSET